MSAMKSLTVAALAGAVTAALSSFASAAGPADTEAMMADGKMEMCFGVALKGENDCASGGHSCAGHSTVDYDPASFKLVATGTCTKMETPNGMGMLKPS